MNVNDTRDLYSKIKEAADFIVKSAGKAEIAIILGSGLNNFTDELTNPQPIPYHDIPHVPRPTVKGHSGKFVAGEIAGKKVFCLAGRSHAYEGRNSFELTFFSRVLRLSGCKLIISTNASGGAMQGMYPGCLMIIKDHINFYRRNPLADTCEFPAFGPHNADLSQLYSERVADIARSVGKRTGVKLFEGVYGGACGPTYETPLEVQAFMKMGGCAFGMSTMPETMSIRSLGMESFAISLITNLASGLTNDILTHTEVTEVAVNSGPAFVRFMKEFIGEITVLDSPSDSEMQLDNAVISTLPQPQFPPATKSQMHEAIAAVQKKIKSHIAPLILILDESHENLIQNLADVEELKYIDIPHFPAITACRHGRIVFGTTQQNRRVACLMMPALEGFACEEATFLVELLDHLGGRILIQSFTSGTITPDAPRGIFVLDDCLETTTTHPYPRRLNNVHQYNPHTAIFNSRHVESLKSSEANVAVGTYAHIAGPSYPTLAEIKAIGDLGLSGVGMTSLSAVFSARAVGMEVVGISENLYFLPSERNQSSNSSTQLLLKFIDSVDIHAKTKSTSYADESPKNQISDQLVVPVYQGDYDQVQQASQFIQSHSPAATLALVIDSYFEDKIKLEKFKIIKEFSFEEIPNLKNFGKGKLIEGELNAVPVFVVHGMNRFENEGLPACEATFHIRMLKMLNVKKMLFLSPMCSVDSKLNLGSYCAVSDHVLLSGRHPLFGPNEDRWGTRFPDAGESYNRALTKAVVEAANTTGASVTTINYGHVTGPVYASKAEAAFASTVGLNAISTSVTPDILVARHMGITCAVLGITVASLDSGKSMEKLPDDILSVLEKTVQAANDLIIA